MTGLIQQIISYSNTSFLLCVCVWFIELLKCLGVSSVMIARGVGKDISLFGKKCVTSLFEVMKNYIRWVSHCSILKFFNQTFLTNK
jgi:hypothetical protein